MVGEIVAWAAEGAVWLSVGAFIAWHVPQPAWAIWAQDKAVAGYKWAKAKYDER